MPADIHPDLRRAARWAPRQIISRRTLPLVRIASRMRGLAASRDAQVVTLGHGASVRVHRPAGLSEPTPGLLWIHGGGYVMGRAMHDDKLCRRFARTLGITVASVEYRLAPENPYPAPVQDCYTGLAWLACQPTVDPARVAIGGASAGGGLAAELAIWARDRGDITPVMQLLTYPMLDDRTVLRKDLHDKDYRLWNQRSNGFGWASYLGDADPDAAVPARHTDLSALPAAWIGVGTLDLFHDENLAYAERLRQAGVPCEVEVVPGAFHGFDQLMPRAGVSRAFFDSQCASLRKAFG